MATFLNFGRDGREAVNLDRVTRAEWLSHGDGIDGSLQIVVGGEIRAVPFLDPACARAAEAFGFKAHYDATAKARARWEADREAERAKAEQAKARPDTSRPNKVRA